MLKDAWELFERSAIPASADLATRRRAELTFYAGASAVLDVMVRIGEADIVELEAVQIVASMDQERVAFAKRMMAAPLPPTRES